MTPPRKVAFPILLFMLLAITLLGTSAASLSARAAARPPSTRLLNAARAALVGYLRTSHPTLMLAGSSTSPSLSSTTGIASFNWSGYADASGGLSGPGVSGTFSSVSAKWTTPAVSCSNEDQLAASWVGLDGFNNQTVEQDGTLEWCFEGQPYYYTWYEMYPADNITVGDTVSPGDQIAARVSASGSNYTLSLVDYTHPANSFSTVQTCARTVCTDTSAEWIVERPAFQIGVAPLANYKSEHFSSGSVTANGVTSPIGDLRHSVGTVYSIAMLDATQTYILNSVSGLYQFGDSFNTSWQNSY